jgi:hypothetical protein
MKTRNSLIDIILTIILLKTKQPRNKTMKDRDIFINAPYGNYKSVRMINTTPAVWVPETYRCLADIKELIELREENASLRLRSSTLDLTKGHLSQCEAALESRDKVNKSLESENKKLKSGCREHQIYYVMRTKLEEAETQNQRLKVIITEREASIDDLESGIADLNALVVCYQQENQND